MFSFHTASTEGYWTLNKLKFRSRFSFLPPYANNTMSRFPAESKVNNISCTNNIWKTQMYYYQPTKTIEYKESEWMKAPIDHTQLIKL